MARVCVVGNATHDLIRTGLIADRRPGGTLLYASLALQALGHEVRPVGNAPLRAYLTLRWHGVDRAGLKLAVPGNRFLNEYEAGAREQWARDGPGPAVGDPAHLQDTDAVLLGPVLGEVDTDLPVPQQVPSLIDLQGAVRRLGSSTRLWRWREVELVDELPPIPAVQLVRASREEVAPILDVVEPEALVRKLAERTQRPAVVTLGPEGAVGYDGELHRARLPALEVEDPTGAGDVFDAGLVHGMLEGVELERGLALGCAAAAGFLEREDARRLGDRFADREAVERQAGEALRS